MGDTKELYVNVKLCCERLEEEVKNNILDVSEIVNHNSQSVEDSFVLEKAKYHHYKEIIKHLTEIKNQIGLIVYHDSKIREFNDKKQLNIADLKKYSYVQQQIKAFSTQTDQEEILNPVHRRKKVYRPTSQISLKSLDIWEKYLIKNEKPTDFMSKSLEDIPRRMGDGKEIRKDKKFHSDTYEEFLDDDTRSFDDLNASTDNSSDGSYRTVDDMDDLEFSGNNWMNEEHETASFDEGPVEDEDLAAGTSSQEFYKNDYSVLNILSLFDGSRNILGTINEETSSMTSEEQEEGEYFVDDVQLTKPKIIDVILKKRPEELES